jgi:hypothetical protein
MVGSKVGIVLEIELETVVDGFEAEESIENTHFSTTPQFECLGALQKAESSFEVPQYFANSQLFLRLTTDIE